MESADLRRVLAWRNQPRIRAGMYTDHEIGWDEHVAWFERVSTEPVPRFLIYEQAGRPVGTVNFSAVDTVNARAVWGFYLGETDVPKGTGTDMGRRGLSWGFDRLGLQKIIGEVFAFNEASLRFHERLGFEREGLLRRHVLKGGRFQDIVLFARFSETWEGEPSTQEQAR